VNDLVGEHELSVTDDGVNFKNYEANKVIFCNGAHHHSLFDWLPLRALKGETLRIKSLTRKELIINRGVYMVPAEPEGEWRVGATYNFQDEKQGVTEHAKLELVTKLRELVHFPFEILDQEWGFRPTTPDRRPILGRHPELRSAFIFNGMGTKGVSLAPYFSEILIHSIENEVPLNKEVDIERYKVLYWSSST